MNILDSIYLNHYSTAYLIAGIFSGLVGIFCLSIKDKSSATLHLGLSLLFGATLYFAFVFWQSVYDPMATRARWFVSWTPFAFQIHAAQFLLRFPKLTHPRFARNLLIAQWSVVVLVTVTNLYFIQQYPRAFFFDGHIWDFENLVIPRNVAALVFLNALLLYAVGIWRTIILKGKDRIVSVSLLVSFFIVTFLPGIGNVMARDGSLERGTFLSMFAILSVVSYFCIAIIYINHAEERTTFMAKIIGISIVTFLLVLQILSQYSLADRETSYDNTQPGCETFSGNGYPYG